jgi:hypothetical protein
MIVHDPSLLAGAAALHALSPEEQSSFEEHAQGCDVCGPELAEFRETAARLGAQAAELPPPALRLRVLSRVPEIRQLPPDPYTWIEQSTAPDQSGPASSTPTLDRKNDLNRTEASAIPADLFSPRVPRRWALLAAAAVIALAVAVGAIVLANRSSEDNLQADPLRTCMLTAQDRRPVSASAVSVGASAVTVSASCGAAIVQLSEIPAPPSGHTYQMWVIAGTVTRSVGTMDPDSEGNMPEVVAPVHLGDTAIGVTVEPTGGSSAPTTTPVIMVPLV